MYKSKKVGCLCLFRIFYNRLEIEYLMEKSLYHTENIPQNRQQLLTLSTCTNADEDGRIIVVAVKN